MTLYYEGTSDATRCNDNHLQDGGPMGTEALEPTHGGEPYWPEIGPQGFVTPACDCSFDPTGGCGTSIHVATVAGCTTSEENEEAMNNDILDEARRVCSERGEDYGDPFSDFTNVAHLWDVVFKESAPIKPQQVALAMQLLKIARITQNKDFYHYDSVLDTIGYAACLEEVARTKKHKPSDEDLF